jgi:hypothetical protein
MRRVASVIAAGLLALSGVAIAAALASTNPPNPAQQCRSEQADPNFAATHGGKTFAQFYGTNQNQANAFGKCVSAKAQAQSTSTATTSPSTSTTTPTQPSATNAAAACRAERSADAAAFKAKYGTNKTKSNAFGKCVSAKAKAHSHP